MTNTELERILARLDNVEETSAEAHKATQEVTKKVVNASALATQDVTKVKAHEVSTKVADEAVATRDHVTEMANRHHPLIWVIICIILAVVLFFGFRNLFLKPDLLNLPGIYTQEIQRDKDGNPVNIAEIKDDDGNVVAYEAQMETVKTANATKVATIWAFILAPLVALVVYFVVPPRWFYLDGEEVRQE